MSTASRNALNALIEQSRNGVSPAAIEANMYASGVSLEKGDQYAAAVQVAQALDELVLLSGRASIPGLSPSLGLTSVALSIYNDIDNDEIDVVSTATVLSASSAVLSVLSSVEFATGLAAGAALSSPVIISATLLGLAAAGLTVLATSDWAGSEDFVELDTLVSGLAALGIALTDHITSVDEVLLGEDSPDYEGNAFRQEILGDDRDNTIVAKAGDDFLAGGGGADQLLGGEGSDFLYGDAGEDKLSGGAGVDYLEGGAGADQFIWNTGDGDDVIGDYDDGGDRIIVNGVDLAALQFRRLSEDSPFYFDDAAPHIRLHYEGDFLTVNIDSEQGGGALTATQYSPTEGQDYGIALLDHAPAIPEAADITVTAIGVDDAQTDPSAYWREQTFQGGVDWSLSTIYFDADDVSNYMPGSLHGTLAGAFEGGGLADYLGGDPDANALHGLGGDDLIRGEAGNDFLEGGAGADVIQGGEGDDIIFGGSRAGLADSLDTESDQASFYLAQAYDEPGDTNTLSGNAGSDMIGGGRYQDYIDGGDGADRIFAGAGEDRVSGGADGDVVYGDSALHYGHFEQDGGGVAELLQIAFADGQDVFGSFDDELLGGDGDDVLWGELGNDVLRGQAGSDRLLGDRVHDVDYFNAELAPYGATLPGLDMTMHGDDRLYGGDGDDLLSGHGGNDLLSGGRGSDSLYGGAGDDLYLFEPGDGLDIVRDEQGVHTLLFTHTSLLDIQVRFQGEHVFIGPGEGSQGFLVAASEWPRVNIALDSPEAVVERSLFETLYLDDAGAALITVPGTASMTEAERDGIFTIDSSDAGNPRLILGPAADEAEVEADSGGGGAIVRLSGGLLSMSLQVGPDRINSGLDFIEAAEGVVLGIAGFSGDIFGTDVADYITGSEAPDDIYAGYGDDFIEARGGDDELYGGWGRDVIVGEAGDDRLDGGAGDDLLNGGAGDDYLYGGQGSDRDTLDGGAGADVLAGGYGPDIYRFAPGDGRDSLVDPSGYHYIEFVGAVEPEDIVLHFTGHSERSFRLEYGEGDAVTSSGTTSAHSIKEISLNGVALPLVHRSDLADASFYDTRSDDVFEMGDGHDTVMLGGWGSDVLRVSSGDEVDTVLVDGGAHPALKGEIRFAADIDLGHVSFSFANGDTVIHYGEGDQLTLDTDTLATHRDNVLGRFTLSAEADPQWMPTIRAVGYVGELHGSHGADHLVGNANVETILPGYGDDIIEAGAGPDWIVLNNLYMHQAHGGIGHKSVSGNEGNDTIFTPLYQGLDFHYAVGDGHDRIEYDWSYSRSHPYSFTVDYAANTFSFNPHGQDSLVFGDGITLDDLRFLRFADDLEILLMDGSGGLRIDNFFPAYDVPPGDQVFHVYELFGEGPTPQTLDHPGLVTALPTTAVASLEFSNGNAYDMAALLPGRLLALPDYQGKLTTGGQGEDHLVGNETDDTIYGFEGDDRIAEYGGNNTINAGEGADVIELYGGNNVLHFGPGSGDDVVFVDPASGELAVQIAQGVDPADISVAYEQGAWGETAVAYLSPGNDTLELVVSHYDSATATWGQGNPTAYPVDFRFADGVVIPLGEFPAPPEDDVGHVVIGSENNDVLFGTEGDDSLTGGRGNDIMFAGDGDDVFIIQGLDQGQDRVSGRAGYDQIIGGDSDDRITLKSLLLTDSVEKIDGRGGLNILAGTAGGNTLDLSATELRNIARVDGGAGSDRITGSPGDDVIVGGAGNDRLDGGQGSDNYLFAMGDGRDRISNYDTGADAIDVLHMLDADPEDLWFSRKNQDLLVDVLGSNDQVRIDDWYVAGEQQLDEIHAGDRVLYRDQVSQLVNAMAVFDVPQGAGAILTADVQSQLEPTLASVWLESA